VATRRLTTVRIPHSLVEWCRCTIVDANRNGERKAFTLTDMIVAALEILRQNVTAIAAWNPDSIAQTLIALVKSAETWQR